MKPLNLTAETWKSSIILTAIRSAIMAACANGDTILKPGKDMNGTLVTAIHKDGYRTHVRIARPLARCSPPPIACISGSLSEW